MNFHDVHQLVPTKGKRLTQFIDETELVLGIRFPLDYLDRASVLTLVDQEQVICGGAIVVLEPPFRSIRSIPTGSEVDFCVGKQEEWAEINGVWLNAEKKSPYLSFTFWSHLISHLLRTNKQHFIFTFDNSNNRMSQVANVFQPEVLYSGKTIKLEGMKTDSDETIAAVNRKVLSATQELLARRGIGKAEPQEEEIIQRIKKRRMLGAVNSVQKSRW
jgi:hypothetical protein